MTGADLAPLAGIILIVAGVLQVFIQMMRVPPASMRQSADFTRDGFKVRSAYPGMTMISAGTLLLIADMLIRQ